MRALTLVSRCREANETSTCRHNIDIGQKIVFWLDFKSLLKYKDNHKVKNYLNKIGEIVFEFEDTYHYVTIYPNCSSVFYISPFC